MDLNNLVVVALHKILMKSVGAIYENLKRGSGVCDPEEISA